MSPTHINICWQVEGNSLPVFFLFPFFWLKNVNYTGPNEPQNHLLCSWLLFIFITGWMQDVHFSAKCSAAISGGELSAISTSVGTTTPTCVLRKWNVELRKCSAGGRPVTFRPARTGGVLSWQHQHHLPLISPPLRLPSKAARSHHFPHTGVPPHTCSPSSQRLRRHCLNWHSLGLVHMYVGKTQVFPPFLFRFFSLNTNGIYKGHQRFVHMQLHALSVRQCQANTKVGGGNITTKRNVTTGCSEAWKKKKKKEKAQFRKWLSSNNNGAGLGGVICVDWQWGVLAGGGRNKGSHLPSSSVQRESGIYLDTHKKPG